jgi:hypothetical protein
VAARVSDVLRDMFEVYACFHVVDIGSAAAEEDSEGESEEGFCDEEEVMGAWFYKCCPFLFVLSASQLSMLVRRVMIWHGLAQASSLEMISRLFQTAEPPNTTISWGSQ